MFLLHLVLDNRASGANALPSTGSAVPTAAEPRTPPNHLPPQVTQRPFARPFRRPVTGSGACWAVTAGLIAVTIGTIPVLYGVLSGDAPAFATADRVIREVPAEVVAAPAAAPPLVDDDTAPAIAAQAPGPDATDVFAPEVADSPASIETDAARETVFDAAPESVPPFTPVVASTSGPSTTMETPEMGVIPVPEELPVVFVTSEGESPAPDTAVKSAAKKPAGHPGKVKELFGIEWHTTLQNASAAARGEPARPIFCFRVLGHLSGFM
jgi:hypothetical protein